MTAPCSPAAVRDTPVDEDVVHVTCCQDEDLAMCGVDVAGHPTTPDETPTGCTVCAALEERSCTEVCPLVLMTAVDDCEVTS